MSDSNTYFLKQITDTLGKHLAAKDQAQRNKKGKNAESTRLLTKTVVATVAPSTKAGEAASASTNKVIDFFLKPCQETQNGLFQGCKTRACYEL